MSAAVPSKEALSAEANYGVHIIVLPVIIYSFHLLIKDSYFVEI